MTARVLLTFALLGGLVGCFTLPEGERPFMDTPRRALEFLVESYSNLDHGGAIMLLHRDFVYYFNMNEVDGQHVPQSWANSDEELFLQKLMSAAEFIHLDLDTEEAPPPVGESPRSEFIDYSLTIEVSETESYHAVGQARFTFGYDPARGWLITVWNDFAPGDELSWSTLRMLFRYRQQGR